MPSAYPGALDTLSAAFTNASLVENTHPAHHNDLANAIMAIQAELGVDPAGAYATLLARLAAADAEALITKRFASMAGKYITGRYYDQSLHGTSHTTLAGVLNRIDLTPMHIHSDVSFDRVAVNCTTAVASATGNIVIYEPDANGMPGALMYQSPTPLDLSTTGAKEATIALSFLRSVGIYWTGFHHSSTATLGAVPIANLANFGMSANTSTSYTTGLRRTVTFASGAPTTWSYVNTDVVNGAAGISVRLRAV